MKKESTGQAIYKLMVYALAVYGLCKIIGKFY